MSFLKNRTVVGVICILLSLLISDPAVQPERQPES